MKSEDLILAWTKISQAKAGQGIYNYLQFRGGVIAVGAILRAIDNRPGILVRFPSSEYNCLTKLESGRGFFFETPIPVGFETFGLPILLGDESDINLFALMGADLVNETTREGEILPVTQRVIRRIAVWRRFMQKRGGLMSAEELRGLFAELVVLQLCADSNGIDQALEAWHGPDRELHDFVFADCLLEVKSWQTERGGRVRISDPSQLLVDSARPVYLVAVHLAIGPSGLLISEFIASLQQKMDTVLSERFYESLAEYGYHDAHSGEYKDRVSVNGIESYEVRAGFPHIDVRAVPGGISGLQYSIELGSIQSYKCVNKYIVQK